MKIVNCADNSSFMHLHYTVIRTTCLGKIVTEPQRGKSPVELTQLGGLMMLKAVGSFPVLKVSGCPLAQYGWPDLRSASWGKRRCVSPSNTISE